MNRCGLSNGKVGRFQHAAARFQQRGVSSAACLYQSRALPRFCTTPSPW
jgi:hypothetical protein